MPPDLLKPLDIYCERLGPGLWAEPLNALTNLAFVAAALLLRRRLADARPADAGESTHLSLLVVLIFCIGLGSALFHTTARVWSAYADMLFIALFIYAYFAHFLRRVLGFGWGGSIVGLALFWLFAAGLERQLRAALAAEWLNGSEGYVAPLLALAAIGGYLRREPAGGGTTLAASGVLCLSLFLRTIDARLCDSFPLGTHFLWHLLNALTLYLVVAAAIARAHRADVW